MEIRMNAQTQRLFQTWHGAACLALSQGCAGPPKTPIAVTSADSIVLERTMCYGTCPAYRLSVTSSGRVSFLSLNPGDSERSASDSISRGKFESLVSQAESLGFFTLPDTIANDRALCPLRATDHPTATLTVFRGARPKRVVDYHGCYAGTERSLSRVASVSRLHLLEAQIDSVAHAERWITPAPLRR
jgi:hypothetical protein